MILPTISSSKRLLIFIITGFYFSPNLSISLLASPGNPNSHAEKLEFDDKKIPEFYPNLTEIYAKMDSLCAKYPHILHKEQIGVSSTKAQPIWALKLSDNPERSEDEPAVLFSSLHHAREAIGVLFTLHFLEEITRVYNSNPIAQELINNLSIWVVPVVNPDGYEYMFQHTKTFPWWRKNIRNYYTRKRNMGLGVDLNRNYNFNWKNGGGDTPSSWYYRGQSAASEAEVQAMQKLALRENILAGATFHSYGELVLFPWGNYYTSPDQDILYEWAKGIANRLEKKDGRDTYDIGMLDGLAGQSSNWMLGQLRAADFTFELGTEYFPDQKEVNKVLHQTRKSVMFFLQNILHTGIRGHVVDFQTGKPVVARILVEGLEASFIAERNSEEMFGRFERLMLPGRYNLTILAKGYCPQFMPEIQVQKDEVTELTVFLMREESSQLDATH
ncbi:MAG: hypothetical protein DWQ05_18455 [Calditrichaeota bacterium]|nr:MAG: hypothetical protein DWQ05_18455 [Calditrichota bacterium]